MNRFLRLTGQLLATLALLAAFSLLLNRAYLPALLLLPAAVALLPRTGHFFARRLRSRLRVRHRVAVTFASLLLVWGTLLLEGPTEPYLDPPTRGAMMTIYENEMARWPVPYESRFLQTSHGSVHVIVSGPEEGRPVVLLHGLAGAAWWWSSNVDALLPEHRVYAIDLIGGAGKSEYFNPHNLLASDLDQAAHLREITELLGEQEVTLIASWEGAYLAVNYALYAPQRLTSLILISPHGLVRGGSRSFRLALSTLLPLPPVERSTAAWILRGEKPLRNTFHRWLELHLSGSVPALPRSTLVTPRERGSLSLPVLVLFGEHDPVAGRVEDLRGLTVPEGRVEFLPGGHLLNAEQPEAVNRQIAAFLEGLQSP